MGCRIGGWFSAIVLALITIISLMAAYNTHFLPTGFVAGTPEGSLALLVLVFAAHLLVKSLKKICPCGADCCGGGCNCGPK